MNETFKMNELLPEEEADSHLGSGVVDKAPAATGLPEDNPISLEKKKKKKKKKDKLSDKASENGSIRGVETMFKSSYTTQLALTTLADNKANIMISINGLILSVVLAGSGSTISHNHYLLLPIGVLLVSSLTAIFLAIRAARPNVYSAYAPKKEDFYSGRANALFFGHFASLSIDDYLKVVGKIMKSRKMTYQLLTRHTHGLGVGLVRKFKLLQWSYTVFISGLGLSIALFIIIYIFLNNDFLIKAVDATEKATAPVSTKTTSTAELPVFKEFKLLDSVNEASGIQQLPDGRFLVINDEKDHPMDILTLDDKGQFSAKGLFPDQLFEKDGIGSGFRKLADLEGIDIDSRGYLYAITSHAFNSKGEKNPSREKLIRFKINGDQITEPSVVTNLTDSIAKKYPFLAKALTETNSKSDDGFNIEGLSLNSTQDKLLIGLRSPLVDKKAVIIGVDNIDDIFTRNAVPEISDRVLYLDLGGFGIRSMNYFPLLNGYLVMSGPVGKSDGVNFNLWLVCKGTETVQPVTVTGLTGFEETEGLAPMLWNGQPRIVMMTDGTLDNSTAARYIILKYEQLNIKNNCAAK